MDSSEPRRAVLRWVKDEDPRWDTDRERVFATVPEGVFRTEQRVPGERLTSDWWRVERDGRVVAYAWLDDVWGDAEILLAVEQGARGSGVGAFALACLEEEAARRGLNYVVNVVRDTHPQRDEVTLWFRRYGFAGTEDGRLRKFVGDRARAAGAGAGAPDEGRRSRYEAERDRATARGRSDLLEPSGVPLGPGHEESGGYVDPEDHRY